MDKAMNDPMTPQVTRIRSVRRESHDTFTLGLDTPAMWQGFEPGQFDMITAFGAGEIPLSISGNPSENHHLVHTIRTVGPVTRAIERLREGDSIGIRGPFGTSWPIKKTVGHDILIIAGGIGLAPLRPAIHWIRSHRSLFGRVHLLVGARTHEDLLFQDELELWHREDRIDVKLTVDHANASWSGRVGVVTPLISSLSVDADHTTALVCGPEIMIRFAARELSQLDIPAENIHVSMERNMKCALGFCGHCQLGPFFVCRDGPVVSLASLGSWFDREEC